MGIYSKVFICFLTSDIILHIDLDTAYLVLPKAKIHIARYYFLLDYPKKEIKLSLNRAILIECKALYHVVSSSAEAETASIFHNAQIIIPI